MKKILTFMLLMLVCIISASASDPINVSTAQQFRDAVTKDHSAHIKLTADIDLSTIDRLDFTFSGTIDGEGTIKNESGEDEIVYYTLGSASHRTKHPIFKALNGATLQNLIIRNYRIEWDDDNIGAVASTAKNSKFSKLIIADISIFNDDDNAGAIVGTAENCDFRSLRGAGNDVTVDGKRAGGFVGLSTNCIYSDCSNSAYSTVYADGSWGNAYAGGFVGESKSDQFVFCINYASIGALDDRIGGIAGYSSHSFFNNSTNCGLVVHCEEKDFLNATRKLKETLTKTLTEEYLDDIQEDLKDKYSHQDFDIAAAAYTFFGTLGLSVGAWCIELLMLTLTTPAGLAAFAGTIIIIAAGIISTAIMLIDAELQGHDELGGICGACEGGAFNTCANYGKLLARDSYIGGIVGKTFGSIHKVSIVHCLNAGEIQGYDDIAGIAGYTYPCDLISHCLNVGTVKTGSESDGSKIDPITNVDRAGGTLEKNYYLSSKYDVNQSERIPVTAEMLKDGTVARDLNDGSTEGPWRQTAGDEYPVPDPSHNKVDPTKLADVFTVSSVDDLNLLRQAVESGKQARYIVYISDDIDCSGSTWTPIGTTSRPFSGICYGNGHTISNINTAEGNSKNGIGFFGVVGINTEVHDLHIGPGTIEGGNSIGAIIGYAEHKQQTDGYIKLIGCSNAATIKGDFDCGGLIGGMYSDSKMQLTIDNCYNTGDVIANKQSSALCGFAKHGATITGSWNYGNVTGYETGKGFARGDNDITVQNCHNYEEYTGLQQTGVSTFTDEDLHDGTLCYKLNGGSNEASVGLPWQQDITASDKFPTYSSNDQNAVYASRKITNNYGTIVLPYTVKSDDRLQYYVLDNTTDNSGETTVNFSAVETLTAGTPAIFRVVNPDTTLNFISSDYLFDYQLNPTEKTNWKMNGNLSITSQEFTDQEELKTLYYISNGEIKGAKNKLTIAPFRSYLVGPTRGSGAADGILNITFDDGSDATGLRLIPVETHDDGTVAYGLYNLAGQRLDTMQPGINIVGGKKVFSK